jgi:hypothetical protein
MDPVFVLDVTAEDRAVIVKALEAEAFIARLQKDANLQAHVKIVLVLDDGEGPICGCQDAHANWLWGGHMRCYV